MSDPLGNCCARSIALVHTGYMTANLLAGVLEAQTRNSLLTGDELMGAARSLVEVIRTGRAVALSSDSVGDRILGAALTLEPTLPLADRSYRFDGCSVLIVAGHISGDASVSARAQSVRALGAAHVEAALLSQWPDPIEGCDAVRVISSDRHLRVVVG